MALWSPRVAHFTLVTDTPANGATLTAFAAKHGCFQGLGDDAVVADSDSDSSSSGDSGGGGTFGSSSHYARRWSCPAWGPFARVLTTPCASAWWGAAGPCCKFDHAAWDFYRRARGVGVVLGRRFVGAPIDLAALPGQLQRDAGSCVGRERSGRAVARRAEPGKGGPGPLWAHARPARDLRRHARPSSAAARGPRRSTRSSGVARPRREPARGPGTHVHCAPAASGGLTQ